ncbi:MAG: hypothetical protein V4613_09995 [Bacteroidota bacterium]
MIAEEYLTTVLEPLKINDTVAIAYEKLHKVHCEILPLVDDNRLLNYIGYQQLDNRDHNDRLSELPLYHPVLPSILPQQHIFDALKQLKSLQLPMLAVQNEEGHYIGILKTSEIVSILSKSLSISSAGSIIVLKILPQNYSLSDLARIIEYNDAKILGVFTFEIEDRSELEVHIKLNTTMLKNILATLERYDYSISQYFSREDLIDDIDSRYQNLMKFLDI